MNFEIAKKVTKLLLSFIIYFVQSFARIHNIKFLDLIHQMEVCQYICLKHCYIIAQG